MVFLLEFSMTLALNLRANQRNGSAATVVILNHSDDDFSASRCSSTLPTTQVPLAPYELVLRALEDFQNS